MWRKLGLRGQSWEVYQTPNYIYFVYLTQFCPRIKTLINLINSTYKLQHFSDSFSMVLPFVGVNFYCPFSLSFVYSHSLSIILLLNHRSTTPLGPHTYYIGSFNLATLPWPTLLFTNHYCTLNIHLPFSHSSLTLLKLDLTVL